MRRIVITVVILMTGLTCFAQKGLKSLPQTVEAFRPEMLNNPSLSEAMTNSLKSKGYGQGSTAPNFVKTYWEAYSDRDENTTYATAKDKNVYSSLSFGEKVHIARIKGDYALVYSAPEEETSFPFLPYETAWKGWVPMSHLILWEQGLTNEKGHKIKALISSSVTANSASSSVGKLFRTPSSPKSYVNLPSSREVFYYVLKSEDGMYLLSKETSIGENAEALYGWVDSNSLIFWDNNVCAEPTWSISKVKEFSSSNISCDLFNDYGQTEKVGSISFAEREMPVYQTDFYRLPENNWRFPVISLDSSYMLYAVPDNSPFLASAANLASRESDLDNVNIVFVIDGSRSYEQYYPIIVDKLGELRKKYKDYTLKAGAMIYRDVRNEDFMTEFCPVQDINSLELLDFIDQGGQYGFKDNSSEPALLDGIGKVLEKANFRPSETNLIIVIGGRGDTSDAIGVNTEALADRLDAANVSLYGIQVQNNKSAFANHLFNYQVSDLIYSKLMARTSKIGSSADAVVQSVGSEGGCNRISYALNETGNSYLENLVYPSEGNMDEAVFSSYLDKVFNSIDQSITRQKNSLGSGSNGLAQLFTQVFSTPKDMAGRGFFDYVVLYEEDEFNNLMESFDYLYNQYLTSSYNTRDYFVFLTKILHIIPETSPIKGEDRGDLELLRILEGRDCFKNEYSGIPLKEINQKKFTTEQYKHLLSEFALKYEKLMEIQKAPYRYSSIINGKKYYWIPIEFLP